VFQVVSLNQTTEDWHTRLATLSPTKSLSERCFAEFILSEAEGLSMTAQSNQPVKCTKVVWPDLDHHCRSLLYELNNLDTFVSFFCHRLKNVQQFN
jgi:hypothetical protein